MATASKFAMAVKKKATAWKKAAKAEPRKGGQYGPADVPMGFYEAIISAECGITEKKGAKPGGVPWARVKGTISDGEHEGKEPSQFYYLDGKQPSDDPDAMLTNEEKLAGDLKVILPDLAVEEILEKTPEQIEALVTEINTRSPKVKIYVRNSVGKPGTKNAGKAFQDVYFNDLLSEGAPNGESQEEESTEEVQESGEEEVTEEESEEEVVEESSDGELESPAVGDTVLYRAKGARKDQEFEVASVNNGKQTVGLKGNGKKITGVPWASLK